MSDNEIFFYQDAQDPLEGFSEAYPHLCEQATDTSNTRKRKVNKSYRETSKRRSIVKTDSFVVRKEAKHGRKLIQIKVVDLTEGCQTRDIDEDSALISAQYVVTEQVDDILDETERVINKISKKLCGYSAI